MKRLWSVKLRDNRLHAMPWEGANQRDLALEASVKSLRFVAGGMNYVVKNHNYDIAETLTKLLEMSDRDLAMYFYKRARSEIDFSSVLPTHANDLPRSCQGQVYFKGGDLVGWWRTEKGNYHLSLRGGAYLGCFPDKKESLNEMLLLGEEGFEALIYSGALMFAKKFLETHAHIS